MMIPAHVLAGIACMHLGLIASKESKHWIWFGVGFAFLSHAIIDAFAIFTYHDASTSGSMFSRFVFWFWLAGGVGAITWALRADRRYGFGILAAMSYDLWDHWILRTISCAPQGFPDGCMSIYAFEHLHLHQLEWIILDTVFAGVERHYGDERFFAVELIFVAALIFSIRWLRDAKPLISES